MEQKRNIIYKTKTLDLDEKGIVKIAVNAFNIKDADGDISANGSFKKTLNENFPSMKWLLNHDFNKMLGVLLSGEETDKYLVMTAKFNMNKQLSLDVYYDYLLNHETGRTLEHSIGVKAIKRDPKNLALVLEWKLFEVSTLYGFGANPDTMLLDIKSIKEDSSSQIEFLKKALNLDYSEQRLIGIEKSIQMLQKAINKEALMVECPCCKAILNYNDYDEHSIQQQSIESAINHARWITENVVAERMTALEPAIREEVSYLLSQKSLNINDLSSFSYIYCPKCWTKITKSAIIEPSDDTQQEKSRDKSTLDLKEMAKYIKLN
ncbi:HK97 family phage prohead protease [Dysgonomonas sp. GY75]|uniref:HK97 family phage prohead protease n=1 Tax=Dysgonomonas sp. GY75 TaxID=2780419 RepID=UPI0018832E63|nr:HK97 family phage prohead protease [Dysgonomonas sp. GY75]MBF0651285.1 HK97 family phage prohead protease [Dysgonomonas sp. GY75]